MYQAALAIEFTDREVDFLSRSGIPGIRYKGRLLSCSYRADFVCFGQVFVETKAVAASSLELIARK